jgi:hypothetical protein
MLERLLMSFHQVPCPDDVQYADHLDRTNYLLVLIRPCVPELNSN